MNNPINQSFASIQSDSPHDRALTGPIPASQGERDGQTRIIQVNDAEHLRQVALIRLILKAAKQYRDIYTKELTSLTLMDFISLQNWHNRTKDAA